MISELYIGLIPHSSRFLAPAAIASSVPIILEAANLLHALARVHNSGVHPILLFWMLIFFFALYLLLAVSDFPDPPSNA